MNPDFTFAHQHLRDIYLRTDDHAKAGEQFLNAKRSSRFDLESAPAKEWEHEYNAWVSKSGFFGFLRYDTEKVKTEPRMHYTVASRYAYLGEKELALKYLELALESRNFHLVFVKAEPLFDSIRNEKRYQDVVSSLGL